MTPTSSTPIDILLVEDNPGDVRLVQEAFREASLETTFHVASDGQKALNFLRKCRESESESESDSETDLPTTPDLVLLDLNLPRVDGFAVLEEMRDDPEVSSPPVLVLTSSEDAEDIAKSYKRAANAYLTKPTSPDEFASLGTAIENFWFEQAELPPATP
ncbi:response regulator [Halobacteria archaeon AArc-m2/3/4]|uniref:Response regulator n=1 Tax=Natronoglomus mannanivorans TaxID=2979990 RepID=A0ABT2QI69_9EURY|nr:response regulator [Halobacteria archaeon AArc-m2/3/4]